METAYRLSGLVNLEELQAMVQANYVATGMPIGIIDAYDGSILVGAGWQTICADFHRAHPVTRQRCLNSDASIIQQARHGSDFEHKCQNGLWDIGIPVLVDGQYAATLFLGQFFYDDEVPDREFFRRQAQQFGFDERCYLAALDRAPVFSRAQVENILSYNRALAKFLGDLATQHLKLQREVDERRRAEEALDERNNLLNALLDNLPLGIFMVEAPTGRPIVANEQARELLGRGILPDANAENLAQFYSAYRIGTGERYPVQEMPIVQGMYGRKLHIDDMEVVRPDGTRSLLEVFGSPVLDRNGQVKASLVSFQDITEQRKIEKALRQSEEQYRELVQSANSIILRWNLAGQITFMNEYGLNFFGYSESELIGRHVMETIVPDSESTGRDLRPLMDQVLVDPLAFTHNVNENIRRDGRRAWIAWTNRVLTDDAGQPVGVLSIGNDITERRAMEEALREANQALSEVNDKLAEAARRKDEFLAMLSHELRNPLAPIRNATYVLNVLLPENDRVQRQREIIDRQLGHMSRLLDDLLDVARITRGKIQLRCERVDLRDIMVQSLESCQARLEGREADLSYTPPEQPLIVDGDPVRLVQVVCNLLNNAAKFSQPGQPITVQMGRQSSPSGTEAWLRIRDAGAGIDPELLPHVFELFVQADKSLDRTKGGLGLGLTLVQRITEMHGGRVETSSPGLGQGAEFTVYLPLASPAAGEAGSDEAASGAGSGAPRPASEKVLVVDDNTDEADTLGELLELWGYEVRKAYDGPTALNEAADFHPGIVLLDIGLPYMNGYEVARRLRAELAAAPPRLVAVTGYGQEEDRRLAEQAGFERHFTKPVDPEQLHNALLHSL